MTDGALSIRAARMREGKPLPWWGNWTGQLLPGGGGQ